METASAIDLPAHFKTLKERERDAIEDAMAMTNNSVSEASRLLGVSRAGLYIKLQDNSMSCLLPRKQKK